MQVPHPVAAGEPSAKKLRWFLVLVGLAMFIIAVTGYPNLLDNERRLGAYALDLLQNGHWFAQRDADGDPISKPPMLTWLVALCSLPLDRVTPVSIYLPTAAATVALVLLLLYVGREKFGWQAGFLGALGVLVSFMGDQQMTTSRYDGLFTLPVTVMAFAAYRGWTTGRGWTLFWIAASIGTLIKGPLALVLGSAGLLAALWERKSGIKQPIRGSHWLGVALFVLIGFGWFGLAYAEMGRPLIDKLIGRELVGHAVTGHGSESFLGGFWEPTYAYFSMFLPWSLAGACGLWRVWKHPSADPETRCFERFLFCWFVVGLVLFSVAAHQRSRLIIPLIPAAALLAGRELSRWTSAWESAHLLRTAVMVTAGFLGLAFVYHHVLLKSKAAYYRTVAVEKIAREIRAKAGEQFPLSHADSPFALQIYLNTMRPQLSAKAAGELLLGSAPAFVAVGNDDYPKLKALLNTNPAIHELLRWPETGKAFVAIFSNHPRLEWPAHSALLADALRIETRNARLIGKRRGTWIFEPGEEAGEIAFSNTATNSQTILLLFKDSRGTTPRETISIDPRATWRRDVAPRHNSGRSATSRPADTFYGDLPLSCIPGTALLASLRCYPWQQ